MTSKPFFLNIIIVFFLFIFTSLTLTTFAQVTTYSQNGFHVKGSLIGSVQFGCGGDAYIKSNLYDAMYMSGGTYQHNTISFATGASLSHSNYVNFRGYTVDISNAFQGCLFATAQQLRTTVKDYIHSNVYDALGVPQSMPTGAGYHDVSIQAALNQTYVNLYVTGMAFGPWYNDRVYFCGYATVEGTQAPYHPDANYSDKVGFVIAIAQNPGDQYTRTYFWNTPSNSRDGKDYDMGITIKKMSDGTMVVVGSQNYSPNSSIDDFDFKDKSCIMIARLDNDLNVINQNAVYPFDPSAIPQATTGNQPAEGYYGVDVWEDKVNQGYYVLANRFKSYKPQNFAIVRFNPNLTVDNTVPSFTELYTTKELWAKKAYPLNNNTSLTMVGQQADLLCETSSVSFPNLQPSWTNINPFIANYNIGWNNVTGISVSNNWHRLHLSSTGTNALGFDYFDGPSFNNTSALEDIGRLYRNTSTKEYSGNGYIIMSPVVSPNGVELHQKSIIVNNNGQEQSCNNFIDDCEPRFYTMYLKQFDSAKKVEVSVYNYWEPFNLSNPLSLSQTSCSTGHYKQNTAAELIGAGNSNINIFPNPLHGSSKVNFQFGHKLVDLAKLKVFDVLGKVVFEKTLESSDNMLFSTMLPNLMSGVYLFEVNSGVKHYKSKITIY